MDAKYWYKNKLYEKINNISITLDLGNFLEDFYIPGYNTYPFALFHRKKIKIFLSYNDNWFPPNSTKKIANKFNIPMESLIESKDHYLTGCWDNIWNSLILSISKEIK